MLFSEVPESAFASLLYPIDNLTYEAGSPLYDEGTNGQAIYSIRKGLIKLVSRANDGEERIVRLLGGGATLGLELLDSGIPYHHTAIALNKADVCRIPVPTIKELEDKFPELCKQIRQRLQDELDQADRWISALNTGTARRRLANLLLLQTEVGANSQGDIQLMTRDDMSAVIGVSTETASRIIAQFKRDGLLLKTATNTYRCEAELLRAVAGNDTGRASAQLDR
jgi:CRP-like cAMP-binding protein